MPISALSLTGALPAAAQPDAASRASGPGAMAFDGLVERFLSGVEESRAQSGEAIRDLALGRTDNMHEVLLQVAQADLSFRLVLEIRNRLLDAYQEVMKMQI